MHHRARFIFVNFTMLANNLINSEHSGVIEL